MKKIVITLVSALLLGAGTMMADDCSFTPDLLPGQSMWRTENNIKATIPVGTIVEVTASISNFVSSDPNVVLVYKGTKAKFFALKTGSATVSYIENGLDAHGNSCETEHSIEYTVEKGTPQAGFEKGGLGGLKEVNFDMGDVLGQITAGFYTPTVKYDGSTPVTYRKPVPANEITYQSSNPSVARMDDNGYLMVTAGGTATITATWKGNDDWNPAQAQLVVNVDANPLHLRVAGIKVNMDNCQDILGDGKKQAVYDPEEHVLTLKNVNWDFSDHNIDAKYGVIEYWGDEDDFIVRVDGTCSFTNTTIGINTMTHNIGGTTRNTYLTIEKLNNGKISTLSMSGSGTQVLCGQGVYVDSVQLLVTSTGERVTAMEVAGIGVGYGGKIVATAEGEDGVAIDAMWLNMDDHVALGEGLRYVSWEQSKTLYGFYVEATAQKAPVVAILSELPKYKWSYESSDNTKGTISTTFTEAEYSEGTEITVTAEPKSGQRFVRWNNGQTDNPFTFTIKQDTCLRAIFAGVNENVETIEATSTEVSIKLKWPFKKQTDKYTFKLYLDPLYLVWICTLEFDKDGKYVNIITPFGAPRRSPAEDEPFTYVVTGLEPNTEYYYVMEARDEAGKLLDTLEGSAKTKEDTATGVDEFKALPAAQKVLLNGRLIITLPDGKQFDATGVQM